MKSRVTWDNKCMHVVIGFISVCLISTSDDLKLFKNKAIHTYTHIYNTLSFSLSLCLKIWLLRMERVRDFLSRFLNFRDLNSFIDKYSSEPSRVLKFCYKENLKFLKRSLHHLVFLGHIIPIYSPFSPAQLLGGKYMKNIRKQGHLKWSCLPHAITICGRHINLYLL